TCLSTRWNTKLGRCSAGRLWSVLRSRTGIARRGLELFSLHYRQKLFLFAVSAKRSGCCSSSSHDESTGWANARCRSQSETSADVSMERRVRAVDRKQSKSVGDLRRRDWKGVAAGNESIQRKSEF